MQKRVLYLIWSFLYILSAALGFIPQPQGVTKALLVLVGVSVFVPGFVLVYQGREQPKELKRICLISGISLGLALVLMIGNILSVFLSEYLGDFLYYLLGVCAAPILCIQYRWLSLFLWACLLMTGLDMLHKLKKAGK